jgi:hypothetical protein
VCAIFVARTDFSQQAARMGCTTSKMMTSQKKLEMSMRPSDAA